jgi:hypothetical protein
MPRCSHPPIPQLLAQIEEADLAAHCSWPAISDYRCTKPVTGIIN